MLLTLVSPQETIFEGEVEKVTIPTEIGIITVLPHHAPLGSIVKPGILSFIPKEKKENLLKKADFLFQDDQIHLSIGGGTVYVDGTDLVVLVSDITANPESDEETLEAMKKELEKNIQETRLRGDIESIEKSYLALQKLTADLRLKKMRHGKY
ncbi:MAG TPA: F0F1 ATP synthase subunit epsilon [Candidatus Absconditabacterales bacterium]|nr:F0F1 ATP synthase subunit epsilon [Candidatus Absconditabacterales bacterium]